MHSTIVITETWSALAKKYEKAVGVQGGKGGALQNLRRNQMNTRLQHVLKKTTLVPPQQSLSAVVPPEGFAFENAVEPSRKDVGRNFQLSKPEQRMYCVGAGTAACHCKLCGMTQPSLMDM